MDVLRQSFEAHQAVVAGSIPVVLPVLERAVDLSVERLAVGAKLLVMGNGGSAAQAAHFAAEITGRFTLDRPAWPAVALAADTVALTAVANDYGFERVFARQVEALARPNDVVVAISTSGRSANVLAGVATARDRGCAVIALIGAGGPLADLADLVVSVPSPVVARVQEVHTICLHAWAEAIEERLALVSARPVVP